MPMKTEELRLWLLLCTVVFYLFVCFFFYKDVHTYKTVLAGILYLLIFLLDLQTSIPSQSTMLQYKVILIIN